jgi:hypothetical protein
MINKPLEGRKLDVFKVLGYDGINYGHAGLQ